MDGLIAFFGPLLTLLFIGIALVGLARGTKEGWRALKGAWDRLGIGSLPAPRRSLGALSVDKESVWDEVCRSLDLSRIDDYPKSHLHAVGEVDGLEVELYREVLSNSASGTVYDVEIDVDLPPGFAFGRDVMTNPFEPLDTHRDIPLAHDRLDASYVVTGREERPVREFVWKHGVDDHLARLGGIAEWVVIREGRLKAFDAGTPPPAGACVDKLERMVEWVRTLREETGVGGDRNESVGEAWLAPS